MFFVCTVSENNFPFILVFVFFGISFFYDYRIFIVRHL